MIFFENLLPVLMNAHKCFSFHFCFQVISEPLKIHINPSHALVLFLSCIFSTSCYFVHISRKKRLCKLPRSKQSFIRLTHFPGKHITMKTAPKQGKKARRDYSGPPPNFRLTDSPGPFSNSILFLFIQEPSICSLLSTVEATSQVHLLQLTTNSHFIKYFSPYLAMSQILAINVYTTGQHLPGACQKCSMSGPSSDLLCQNLHFDKLPS